MEKMLEGGECVREDDCIFCKIANGGIPSETIYEDDMFRVIMDLGPASKGHALILPSSITEISVIWMKIRQQRSFHWQQK
jgi:diadenosine tetraphosphate (Ap4A) HIT family hydrolase